MNMINNIKKVKKWLLLVLISICVVFTVIKFDDLGIASALSFKSMEEQLIEMNLEDMKIIVDSYEENMQIQIEEMPAEGDSNYNKMLKENPVGTYMMLKDLSQTKTESELVIISGILGILVGTGIYFVIYEDKRGIKLLAIFYIASILLLGFLEGIYITEGSLLDRWLFPATYIFPATLMFGLVLVFFNIKQQNLARELNRKLQEEKKKKQIEEGNTEERKETFLERTRETREKIADIGSQIIEIIMILIAFIYFIYA